MLTFGSLFAGIEGFGRGFHQAGLAGSWAVELEPDCRSVIQRHFPSVGLWADVRKVGAAELAPVDVLCGGFPCQDLSVAGKRGGLEGKRSGLFWEMVRVIDELRPRYVVWENVGGLASSDSGRDFPRILRGLADVGYFGAVRLVDARWYGVPQRRRRYFGVFARCDSGAEWRRACEVLAVGESLQRHPAESGKTRKDVAYTLTSSVGRSREGNRVGNAWNTNYVPQVAGTLTTREGQRWDVTRDTYIPTNFTDGTYHQSETAGTLTKLTDQSRGVLAVYQCHGSNVGPMGTLRKGNGSTTGGVPFVAFAANQRDEVRDLGDCAGAIQAQPGMKQQTFLATPRVGVRRMTPLECERCQGFPDGWTELTHTGERISDARRYAMIGNSVVPQVAEWIGRRLMSARDQG